MTDPGAANVRLTPRASTIASLIALVPPDHPTDRVAPTEERVFRVKAVVVLVKPEDDSDYHVVLEDAREHDDRLEPIAGVRQRQPGGQSDRFCPPGV